MAYSQQGLGVIAFRTSPRMFFHFHPLLAVEPQVRLVDPGFKDTKGLALLTAESQGRV